MKHRIVAFATALTILGIAAAQDPVRDPKPMPPVQVGIKALSFMVGNWSGKGFQMMGDQKMEWSGTLKSAFVLQDSHIQMTYNISMDGQKMEGMIVIFPDAVNSATYKGVNFESGGTMAETMNAKLDTGKLVFAMPKTDSKAESKMEMSASGTSLKVQMYDKSADGKWVLMNEGTFTKS